MTSNHTGYEGPFTPDDEEEKTKPPEDCEWELKIHNIADSDSEPEVVFVTISIDGQVLGSVRLPNPEYLRFLRERISGL